MKNKPKQITKPNSQSNTILINEIGKKNQLKKREREWVNCVNLSNSWPVSWNEDNTIKNKSNVQGHVTRIMRPI